MTYGWAIIVLLVVIASLWFFIGNPQLLISDNCKLAPPLNCEGVTVSTSTDTITLRLKNGLNEDVTITNINLVEENCDVVVRVSILADSFANVTFTCATTGSKIKSSIIIKYSTPGLTGRIVTGNLVASTGLGGSGSGDGNGGGADENICQNAEDGGLCGGLDILFGEGYQANCCSSFSLCY